MSAGTLLDYSSNSLEKIANQSATQTDKAANLKTVTTGRCVMLVGSPLIFFSPQLFFVFTPAVFSFLKKEKKNYK